MSARSCPAWSKAWRSITTTRSGQGRSSRAFWFAINDWTLGSGQGFNSRDYSAAAKSVILGETVRRELFGDEDALGQTVRLGRVPFTVVATLQPKGQGGFGQDQDDLIVVPLETARRRLTGAIAMPAGAVQAITLGVADAKDLDYAQGEVKALLRQRHKIPPGGDDDFSVRNIAQIVATRTQTTKPMSLLLGAVASISLIVGGIGIMNIMLVSVTERIREIGLRMAVGAGTRDIRRQFLAEAMLISLIGGVLGIAIGVPGAVLVGKLGSLPVALNAQVIGLAAGFSIATGLVLRLLPREQGGAPGSDRGAAAALGPFPPGIAPPELWQNVGQSRESNGEMADSSGSHAPRSPFRAWQAFLWSMQGLRAAWQVESSFRLEVYLFVLLAPLAVWLGANGAERAIMVGSMILVLVVEVLNSAVEAVVDRWGQEQHELAGRAKDMGSAAVFLADMNVLVCWGLILGPRLMD